MIIIEARLRITGALQQPGKVRPIILFFIPQLQFLEQVQEREKLQCVADILLQLII